MDIQPILKRKEKGSQLDSFFVEDLLKILVSSPELSHGHSTNPKCNFFYRPHPKDDGRLYFHFVCQSTPRRGGGVPGLGRGVPDPAMDEGGGPRSQNFRGEVPGLRFSGGGGAPRSQIFRGVPGLRFSWGGGLSGLNKGKNF